VIVKALVKSRPEPGLWLDEIETPTIGINDVLIRVLRTGICGTDVHIYKWDEWAQATIRCRWRSATNSWDGSWRWDRTLRFFPATSSAAKGTWSADAAATAWPDGGTCAPKRAA